MAVMVNRSLVVAARQHPYVFARAYRAAIAKGAVSIIYRFLDNFEAFRNSLKLMLILTVAPHRAQMTSGSF